MGPERLCACGCGAPAGFYASWGKRHRPGEPRRYINGHNGVHGGRPYEPLAQRYRVEDRGFSSPCWIWLRARSRKGYGYAWDSESRRVVRAHRLLYEQAGGVVPVGHELDHLCRVRECVRPDHLEAVTQHVNQQRGANAKLTRAQADEIRRRGRTKDFGRRSPNSGVALAREFGVTPPVVYGIIRGDYWP